MDEACIKSGRFALDSYSCDDNDDIEIFPDETMNAEYSDARVR
jgi:hypothetical protein